MNNSNGDYGIQVTKQGRKESRKEGKKEREEKMWKERRVRDKEEIKQNKWAIKNFKKEKY